MSEKKKQIIHVKDLIIKADHVTLDYPESKQDPFFGPRKPRERFVHEEEERSGDVQKQETHEDFNEEQQERKADPILGIPRRRRENTEPRKPREYDPILGRPLHKEETSTETKKDEENNDAKEDKEA